MTQRSEAARGFVRIASNYLRLLSTFLIGLLFVRLALRFGTEAYGLIVLLGVSTGVLNMIYEIVSWSMVRELGTAYHSGDDRQFRSAFSTALVVCFAAAVATVGAFGLLALILPWLKIDAFLLTAARWFVLFAAVQSFFRIALAPAINMYLISERMVAVSLLDVVARLLDLLAVVLTLMLVENVPGTQIVSYGLLSNGLASLQICAASVGMIWLDRRMLPALSLVTRQEIISMVKTSGWNTVVSVAMNLGNRTDAVIMNVFFGLGGNLVFGIGLQVAAYARMLAQGMTIGIDAVATRISAAADAQAIRGLLNYTTRLHGWVAFPAGLGCCFLVEPFLHVWVGNQVKDPAVQIPQIVAITRVLLIALTVRSISDGWTRVLYGAGHIRTYAPLVFIGAMFNPFLSVALLWVFPNWYTAPAWAHSSLFLVVHLLILPGVLERRLAIGYRDTLLPLVRPLIATLLCAPVLVWANWNLQDGDLLGLAATVAVFSVAFLIVSWLFVLDGPERRRFANAAKRRLGGLANS